MRKLIPTALALLSGPALSQEKTEFRVAWSIYVSWMPWGYLETSGIMDKSTYEKDIPSLILSTTGDA